MSLRISALLLLVGAACTAPPADDRAAIPAAASALRPAEGTAAAPDQAYLVWSTDSADAAETAWIDGEGRVVARRPGVYAAGGGTVWRWTEAKTPWKGVDCECLRAEEYAEGAQCVATAPVAVAALVDESGERTIPMLVLPTGEDLEIAPPEQEARPLSGVGPFLLVERRMETYACGAHGSVGVEWAAYDLRAGAPAALLDSAETHAATAREGAAALAELRREMEPEEAARREVELTAVEARWSPDGALRVGYQFTTGACYACSDGLWSSYTRSAVVPAGSVPRPLAAFTPAPEAVRRHWRASPPGERAGWSAVDAPDLAAALARFRGR
jgi:hypothetical protein